MKYCLRYQRFNTELMKSADEILINYNKSDTTLLDFLQKYEEKRIIISVSDIEDFKLTREIEKIKAIRQVYTNFNICMRLETIDNELISELKECGIPFFIRKFVNDWDTFDGLIKLGVSDMYIVETLAFEMDKCGERAHEFGINIRVFPNIAQSQFSNTEDIKKFFIRPEDVHYYESYVDVFEFFGDISKENTIYKVYAIDEQWFGELRELIIGLQDDIDGRYIIPRFGEKRVLCAKKCMKNGKCDLCNTVKELANTLRERDIIVLPPTEDEEEKVR